MRRKLQFLGVIGDQRAIALTEFAIVIPVILFFFLVLIQYVVIVQTAQLCNYAAYVAARSYAVHAKNPAEGPSVATDLATNAAALALAPVARMVPGEFFGINVNLPSELPNFPGSNVGNIWIGWQTALVRLQDIGSISISPDSGNSQLVDVEIDYPQPIFIPGLAELWSIMGGEKGIHTSLSNLSGGTLQAGQEAAQAYELYQAYNYKKTGTYIVATGTGFILPYITIKAKCTMACENWGSEADYRPRIYQEGDPTGSNGADPAVEQQLQNLQNAQNQVNADNAQVQSTGKQVVADEQVVSADKTTVANDQNAVNSAQAAVNADQPGSNQWKADNNTLQAAQSQLNQANNQLNQAQSQLSQDQTAYNQAQATSQNDQSTVKSLISGLNSGNSP
jgi:hypothetical protein